MLLLFQNIGTVRATSAFPRRAEHNPSPPRAEKRSKAEKCRSSPIYAMEGITDT